MVGEHRSRDIGKKKIHNTVNTTAELLVFTLTAMFPWWLKICALFCVPLCVCRCVHLLLCFLYTAGSHNDMANVCLLYIPVCVCAVFF